MCGKVNSARTTQILIDNFNLDYVINVGVAGGVNSNLNVGDVVIGKSLVQYDFDLTKIRKLWKRWNLWNWKIYIFRWKISKIM